MFDALEGIREGSPVVAGDRAVLEELIKRGEGFVQESRHPRGWVTDDARNYELDVLKQLRFTEQDLQAFVVARSNDELPDKKSRLLGKYTGIMLDALTARNKEQGKRTRLYIDGRGNRFDYLFHGTTYADQVIISNLEGEQICCSIRSINYLLLTGCRGEIMARNNENLRFLLSVSNENCSGYDPSSLSEKEQQDRLNSAFREYILIMARGSGCLADLVYEDNLASMMRSHLGIRLKEAKFFLENGVQDLKKARFTRKGIGGLAPEPLRDVCGEEKRIWYRAIIAECDLQGMVDQARVLRTGGAESRRNAADALFGLYEAVEEELAGSHL